MEKIDLKDRKILFELDHNARISISEISKKIKLTKGGVVYRLKKLEESGVIKNYYTVIDTFKIGYICVRYLIKLQYATIKTKETIKAYFEKYPNTWYIAEPEGKYDLLITIWGKNIRVLNNFWNKTLETYNDYFHHWTVSLYVESLFYHHSFLIDTHPAGERGSVEIIGDSDQIKIDDLEFRILRIISSNARIPLVELANQLTSNVKTIRNRIKKLENMGVIKGYRIGIDISKLGYKFFEVEMNLKNYNERNKIINFIRKHSNMVMIDNTLSPIDLEFEYQLKDINDLKDIIDDLMNKFPNSIRNYDYFYFPNIDILNYFPNI
jgi:Lrp/AsnC family transcriptional regulator for asnA, asnC and gidA